MSMFCNQCQETLKNQGCTTRGVCGKSESTANLQDLLVYVLRGMAMAASERGYNVDAKYGRFLLRSLFVTITNVNFDENSVSGYIKQALELRDEMKAAYVSAVSHPLLDWSAAGKEEMLAKAKDASILKYSENEDIRSLKTIILYGLKGIGAYGEHAAVLGKESKEIYSFIFEALDAMNKEMPTDDYVKMVLKTGEYAVKVMALLDEANTFAYGHPEITKVSIGVGTKPGILISGHDLKDMEELLRQTDGTGVDVYTHGEMLPAHYYPALKKYSHLKGNYGGSWWKQAEEFESFNGPVLMTTNCIVPVRESYKNRFFTTGEAAYPGTRHIEVKNGKKDFSVIIELAKKCAPPKELETGEIVGGFAHNQLMTLADKVVAAVKSGAIKKFVVMAGCDGRHKERSYFTEVARNLPKEAVILTAGCAKYRYNKLKLGDIGGIPRVLDAGQCNDSYSLAVIALKLKEIFDLGDVSRLPIAFDIAWYEQKAVTVLLALLYLGFKGIRLGPTLPAFISPGVAKVLVENFGIRPIGTVEKDIEEMMSVTKP